MKDARCRQKGRSELLHSRPRGVIPLTALLQRDYDKAGAETGVIAGQR
jgi:hypothetical protein